MLTSSLLLSSTSASRKSSVTGSGRFTGYAMTSNQGVKQTGQRNRRLHLWDDPHHLRLKIRVKEKITVCINGKDITIGAELFKKPNETEQKCVLLSKEEIYVNNWICIRCSVGSTALSHRDERPLPSLPVSTDSSQKKNKTTSSWSNNLEAVEWSKFILVYST